MGFMKKISKHYRTETEVSPVQRLINNTQEQEFIARRVLRHRNAMGGVNFYFFGITLICQFLTDL